MISSPYIHHEKSDFDSERRIFTDEKEAYTMNDHRNDTQYALVLDGVVKRDAESIILHDISFKLPIGTNLSIQCNDHYAIALIDIITSKTLLSEGHIHIMDSAQNTTHRKNHIACIFKEEGYYDRLNIHDYLTLFKELKDSDMTVDRIVTLLGFNEMRSNKIKHFTYSQKRRLSFARAMIENPDIILVHEPFKNVDLESKAIIMKAITEMNTSGMSILSFSSVLEDALLLDAASYILDDGHLRLIEKSEDSHSDNSHSPASPFKIEKIPAKVEDKIILLNPAEIKYIEADRGVCYISIAKDKVPCTLTMHELENRLGHLGFFRAHRSYLVNLQRIREVIVWTRNSYSLVLDDTEKTTVPLSKGRIDDLKDRLNI